MELFSVWKEWKDVCFGIDEARDVLDTETLVLRNRDVPDVGPVDGCLGSAHQIFKKVDGDLLCSKEMKVSSRYRSQRHKWTNGFEFGLKHLP